MLERASCDFISPPHPKEEVGIETLELLEARKVTLSHVSVNGKFEGAVILLMKYFF
jgi:hypothetical protein